MPIQDVLNRRKDFPKPAERLGECFQVSLFELELT